MLVKTLEGNWSLSGEPSLQNALQLAMNSLKYVRVLGVALVAFAS